MFRLKTSFLNQEILYSDHEIFLRIDSNGTDATLKLKHLTSIGKVEYGNPIIEIKVDKEGKKFTSLTKVWDDCR
jgi:molecular chaperone HtpG